MSDVMERVALKGVAPIVPVRRVARTVGFYTEVLGFDLVDRDRAMTYAYVRRGEAGFILLDLGEPEAVRAAAHYQSAYVWVEGIEGLWTALEPRLSRLPAGRVRPLFAREDGRREFHVRDPDGVLLFFGEPPRR